jgi:hypothetical protein
MHARLLPYVLWLAFALSGDGTVSQLQATHQAALARVASASCPDEVSVALRNVVLHEYGNLRVRVPSLRGEMCATQSGKPISLDDPNSFSVHIHEGTLATSLQSLSETLNAQCLRGSSLKNVRLFAQGSQIRLTGTVQKLVPLPVEGLADVSVAPSGYQVRLHMRKLHVLKLPVKRLLAALSVQTQDLVDLKATKGISIAGDDIDIDTGALLPPPRKSGKLWAVHVSSSGELVEQFGSGAPAHDTDAVRNYIRLTGGTVELGKIVMNEADILVADSRTADWFHFDLARYAEQLVKGRTQLTARGGLEIFVPDSTQIPASQTNLEIDREWKLHRTTGKS